MTTSDIEGKSGNKGAPEASLVLTLDMSETFLGILQEGFKVKIRFGSSIKNMLCEQCGLSPEVVEERVKTVFLDGKPVDDVDSAMIRAGSTVALSASMPGLVGATMRRGGLLASFRATTTHREEGPLPAKGEGMVTVKLFNLLIKEIGPIFLERGIWVRRETLEAYLRTREADFWRSCKSVRVDGKELDRKAAAEVTWPEDREVVLFTVHQPAREDR